MLDIENLKFAFGDHNRLLVGKLGLTQKYLCHLRRRREPVDCLAELFEGFWLVPTDDLRVIRHLDTIGDLPHWHLDDEIADLRDKFILAFHLFTRGSARQFDQAGALKGMGLGIARGRS